MPGKRKHAWYSCLSKFSSVQFNCSAVSESLRPHESQHARPPCPSPTPGVHSDSCPCLSYQALKAFTRNKCYGPILLTCRKILKTVEGLVPELKNRKS